MYDSPTLMEIYTRAQLAERVDRTARPRGSGDLPSSRRRRIGRGRRGDRLEN